MLSQKALIQGLSRPNRTVRSGNELPSNSETPYFSLTFLSEMTHYHLAVPDILLSLISYAIESINPAFHY